MRAITSRLALLVLVAVLSGAAQDGRFTEVSGEVYDMLGKPIANAVVVYSDPEHGARYRFLTDLNGKFHAVGVISGAYDVQITTPEGDLIFSGKKYLYTGEQTLNVVKVDLSVVPTRTSLAPFKGPNAAEIQGAPWRKLNHAESVQPLAPEQAAELRAENADIARYNELAPEARSAIKAQDWTRASELLELLTHVAPYQWRLYQNLGTVLRSLHRDQEAIQALEKGIQFVVYDDDLAQDRRRLNSTLAQMMSLEGEAYNALDQPAAAAEQYRKAAQIDPQPALAYVLLCIAEYHNGKPDAALEACGKGIAADPAQPEYYQVLAGIESNLEKYADAIPVYEKGIRMAERKMESSKISASLPRRLPRSDMAGADQLLLSEGNVDYKFRAGQMLLAEGNAYFQLKKYQPAAALFAEAAKWHAYPALPYFNLCATEIDMGNVKAAVDACSQAIASDPSLADAYYVKAAALAADAAKHSRFQSPPAVIALQKYLELAPEGIYAGDARTLLKELGSGAKAK